MADGFSEASQAFSEEVEATTGSTDFVERSIAGVIRANARFLEELASVIGRDADDLSAADDPLRPEVVRDEIDYDRLADLVVAKLRLADLAPSTPPVSDPKTKRP